MPPTVVILPGGTGDDEEEEDEEDVLLFELATLEPTGKKPLNLVLIGALPGITVDDKVLILAILLQPLRCQNPS